jgi:hypothetical protein
MKIMVLSATVAMMASASVLLAQPRDQTSPQSTGSGAKPAINSGAGVPGLPGSKSGPAVTSSGATTSPEGKTNTD